METGAERSLLPRSRNILAPRHTQSVEDMVSSGLEAVSVHWRQDRGMTPGPELPHLIFVV